MVRTAVGCRCRAMCGLCGAAVCVAGDRCMETAVVIAGGNSSASVRAHLTAHGKKPKPDIGTSDTAEMAPLVTRQHLDKVKG